MFYKPFLIILKMSVDSLFKVTMGNIFEQEKDPYRSDALIVKESAVVAEISGVVFFIKHFRHLKSEVRWSTCCESS